MSTDGIFPPRWRTTTPTTSCCSAPAATPLLTCTTASWSSSWLKSSPPLRVARRESACWRTRTEGGFARRLGLCSPPGKDCRSSDERSCRLWSRASSTRTRSRSWRTRRCSRQPVWRRGEFTKPNKSVNLDLNLYQCGYLVLPEFEKVFFT